jgi:hypothetical protein
VRRPEHTEYWYQFSGKESANQRTTGLTFYKLQEDKTMIKEDFMKLPDLEKLLIMKKALNYLSHDFQHQEIIEIESVDSNSGCPKIKVWEKGVSAENWPKFIDYYHHKVTYEFRDGTFELAENC